MNFVGVGMMSMMRPPRFANCLSDSSGTLPEASRTTSNRAVNSAGSESKATTATSLGRVHPGARNHGSYRPAEAPSIRATRPMVTIVGLVQRYTAVALFGAEASMSPLSAS
jgi:hypothetical protein